MIKQPASPLSQARGPTMSEESTGTTSAGERQPTNPAGLIRHAKRAYENFLEWADEDTLAEWVDGVVIICTGVDRCTPGSVGLASASCLVLSFQNRNGGERQSAHIMVLQLD